MSTQVEQSEKKPRARKPSIHLLTAGGADVAEMPRFFPLTDVGNAERLVALHGDDMRYCHPGKAWWVWTGKRWEPDTTGESYRRAKATIRALRAEVPGIKKSEVAEAMANWAARSEGAGALRSMLECARGEPGMPIQPSHFDRDPWLFNCANGTINLRGNVFREHRRDDYLSKSSPVAFEEEAKCPTFMEFLQTVQPDPEIQGFLQRLSGYWLTGVIRDHVFPIFIGKGRNGKGTFVDTILHILGDYGKQVPTELLMAKKNESHPADKATLWNARFAAAEETDEGRSLNVALVKQLTGGGRISARFMGENWFDFDPTHKMVLSTNNRPTIRETKEAIWERVQIVDWGVVVPREKRILNLKERLAAEAPGILRWMLAGCAAWQTHGLKAPAAVAASTSAYRDDMDPVGEFIRERCDRDESPGAQADSRMTVQSTHFLERFNEWAKRMRYPELDSRVMKSRMTDRGFTAPRKGSDGCMYYHGISLRVREERNRTGERDD